MLKKLAVRLLFLSLVAIVLAPFILKRENGDYIMTWQEAKKLDPAIYQARYILAFNRAIRLLDKNVDTDLENTLILPEKIETKKMYRWQDENGEWHYSDKEGDPESGQHDTQVIAVDPDSNVMSVDEMYGKKDQ